MATRETKADRGRRIGREQAAKLLGELRQARLAANVSQRTVARALGWSHTRYGRFENDRSGQVAVVDVGAAAAVLGLRLGSGLYPLGEALRDAGHQALIARFLAVVSDAWVIAREVPLLNIGDQRAWDVVLRVAGCVVGVECETRTRDIQALARHMHQRIRDGRADAVVLVLADTRTNRAALDELRAALGPEFQTEPGRLLLALAEGQPLPGSGVVLV